MTCYQKGNSEKNWVKHRVSRSEIEQAFFNRPFIFADDVRHSQDEPRFYALGQTDRTRKLFMIFTIREKRIRVISARDMNRSERKVYDEKEDSEIRE
jgi:uncharacterized DUF497 family protein